MPFDFDMDSMSPVESGGGGVAPTGTISITENGEYNVTNYASADVNVVNVPNIESLSITPSTSAQTITASGGVDGYSPISVSAVTASIDPNISAQNIKKDVQILGVTGTLEGSGKYKLLQRITDDSNNEIGVVSGFFTDENNTEYAVVCLYAQYRTKNYFNSVSTAVTDLPLYQNLSLWSSKETATFNTQKILDYASSGSCTHCRSKSFVINGVTYYGQLPNIAELVDIYRRSIEINTADPRGSSSDNRLSTSSTSHSSNQRDASNNWQLSYSGSATYSYKTSSQLVCPVLEIPNV